MYDYIIVVFICIGLLLNNNKFVNIVLNNGVNISQN